MKTLQTTLRAVFGAAQRDEGDPRSHARRRAREQARRLGARIGVCFERLSGGAMIVWPPQDCPHDPYAGDHYARDWIEALARVVTYTAVQDAAIEPCLQRLAPRTRALLNESLCNDEVSSDEELQAHWRAELGLTHEQAAAALTYRPRRLREVWLRPFAQTLDTV
jgi:hypothetical protein